MGLDMYSYSVNKNDVEIDKDNNSLIIKDFDTVRREELCYWRKHNALHKWMQDLYVSRNGMEDFNCVPIILNQSDLLKLKDDVLNDRLIPKDGFFFGGTDKYNDKEYYEETKKIDLQYIDLALSKIDGDTIVYYDSWW